MKVPFLDFKFQNNTSFKGPCRALGALCLRIQRLRAFRTESSHRSRGPRPPGKAPLVVNDSHQEFGHLWDSSEPGNVFFRDPQTGETVTSVAFGSLDKNPAMLPDGGLVGFLVCVCGGGRGRGEPGLIVGSLLFLAAPVPSAQPQLYPSAPQGFRELRDWQEPPLIHVLK